MRSCKIEAQKANFTYPNQLLICHFLTFRQQEYFTLNRQRSRVSWWVCLSLVYETLMQQTSCCLLSVLFSLEGAAKEFGSTQDIVSSSLKLSKMDLGISVSFQGKVSQVYTLKVGHMLVAYI